MSLHDRLSSRTSKVFTPIGNLLMRSTLACEPLSKQATHLTAALAVFVWICALYINTLP